MKRLAPFLLSLVLAPCVSASGFSQGTIEHGGRRRTYRYALPEAAAPRPLLIALHGGGGNSRAMDRLAPRLRPEALSKGFIVLFPDGFRRNWNDGRDVPDSRAHSEGVDDAGFIAALIRRFEEEHGADPKRVYATGASNGGFMSFRLACELSDRVAAIAPVIASQPDPGRLRCEPFRPVPVLMINGTEDPLVTWEGETVSTAFSERGRRLNVEATARLWARLNGCAAEAASSALPDLDPEDGTRTSVSLWSGCRDSSEVRLYKIEGGGHTWPQGLQYLPKRFVGRMSRDLDAVGEILAFFSRFSR